ncbi:hypothetical protein A3C86_03370 [Candidatus Kaiserbacteria bacterium RIFCSPHIGHO2_02_FULL_49_16]|uniref:Uncharacterized protein n=1 Tax=Candidatus Kaiserbacteria bacterium RIFCSPHIGHO2_02_FULL_49_16 TaxID=1798490 RepID=A0A1F6DCP4_9BACT|nr:MAG: hypothetical protein A3C86_03370 [Candidatus Kaiserbacteria bacterium RIFCSPHIGHO2_02_FULL_49_16]
MQYSRTPQFERAFKKLQKQIKRAFEKQLRFLLSDIRHPSLRAKKYDETRGIWQARVTDNVRFYFQIVDDRYRILDIEKHRD